MVIKGNARGGAAQLATHLLRTDTNERAELIKLEGVAARDLRGALLELEAVASGARSQRHFYHASINTRADEQLTPEQRDRAIDRLAEELGLSGQPRAVMLHEKEGRQHFHIVWSRIDLETMKAIPDSHNFRRHEIVARELEREFGHERVPGVHHEREGERPERTPSHAEMMQAERSGMKPAEAKALITGLWQATDSGQAFAAALEDQGWILARGDKRDFVAVDPAGEVHSLAKRVDGAKAKDVRARLADLDQASLPGVATARAAQLEQARQREQAMADRKEEARRKAVEAEEQRRLDAAKQEEERQREAIEAEERRKEQARRDEAQRREAAQKEEETKRQQLTEEERRKDQLRREGDRQAQQNADRQLEQTAEMKAAYEREQQRLHVYARKLDEEASQAKKWLEQQQTLEQEQRGTRDAGARYAQALGDHYDVRDPYGSLARAAMAEHAAFRRDREQLSRQIDAEADPAKRDRLEARQKIELADYMAITSDRIANQSEVIVGRSNTDEALRQRARAALFREEAKELRQQLRPAHEQAKDNQTAPAPDRPMTAAEYAINPAARRQHQQAQADQRTRDKEREEALNRIDTNLAGGLSIDSQDLRKLRRAELEQIQKDGREGLREVLDRHREERSKTKAADPGDGRQRDRDRD